MEKERIEVSPEMVAHVGPGVVVADWPAHWLVLRYADLDGASRLSIGGGGEEAALVFAVDPAACRRLFGRAPESDAAWHLPSDLRAIALAIRDCGLPEPARATLRLGKCIELLCATLAQLADEALVAADADGALSAADAQRILAARRLVDERWREKLTLDAIARACGLNRAKLTRGFRLLFRCSVADALAENRLGGARAMLRETDLPVSSIGYKCGYLNNASFTRAFSRRFGQAPTQLRNERLAA